MDAVCTRAIIIARGKVVADDTPQGLATRSRYHNAVSLRLEKPEQLAAARSAIAALPSVAEVEVVEREARLTALPKSGQTLLNALSELATQQGLKLKELHLESGRLDGGIPSCSPSVARRPRCRKTPEPLIPPGPCA